MMMRTQHFLDAGNFTRRPLSIASLESVSGLGVSLANVSKRRYTFSIPIGTPV
jgi:hypothetical protein